MQGSRTSVTVTVLLSGVAVANALAALVLLAAGDDPVSDWVSPWLFVAMLAVCSVICVRCLVLVRRFTRAGGRHEMQKGRPDDSSS